MQEEKQAVKAEYPSDFETFWAKASRYHGKPSKKMVLKSYEKRQKEWERESHDTSFSEHLCLALDLEETRRRAERKAGKFVPDWPHWTTWLNQYRDQAEFDGPSHVELQQQAEQLAVICYSCGATDEVMHWNSLKVCPRCHFEKHADKTTLREGYRLATQRVPRLQGESGHDWYKRHSAAIRKAGGVLKRLPYGAQERLAGNQQAGSDELLTGTPAVRVEGNSQALPDPFHDYQGGDDEPVLQNW